MALRQGNRHDVVEDDERGLGRWEGEDATEKASRGRSAPEKGKYKQLKQNDDVNDFNLKTPERGIEASSSKSEGARTV